MNQTLVVDNFLENPDAYRAFALKQDFYTLNGLVDGTYKNVSIVKTTEHKAKIEAALGRPISQDYSFLRFALYADAGLNHLIHADSGISPWGCVLYLNTPDQIPEGSGTAFYSHKKLKMERAPNYEGIRASGRSPKRVWDTLEASWNDASAWQEISRAEMKFNRAIFFETDRFHSRLPLEGFGTDMETARLIFVSFFKVL